MCASNTEIAWSKEKLARLTGFVQKSPCLWDTSHPDYYKNKVKDVHWNVIGDLMNESASTCKSEWSKAKRRFKRNAKTSKSGEDQKELFGYKRPQITDVSDKDLVIPVKKQKLNAKEAMKVSQNIKMIKKENAKHNGYKKTGTEGIYIDVSSSNEKIQSEEDSSKDDEPLTDKIPRVKDSSKIANQPKPDHSNEKIWPEEECSSFCSSDNEPLANKIPREIPRVKNFFNKSKKSAKQPKPGTSKNKIGSEEDYMITISEDEEPPKVNKIPLVKNFFNNSKKSANQRKPGASKNKIGSEEEIMITYSDYEEPPKVNKIHRVKDFFNKSKKSAKQPTPSGTSKKKIGSAKDYMITISEDEEPPKVNKIQRVKDFFNKSKKSAKQPTPSGTSKKKIRREEEYMSDESTDDDTEFPTKQVIKNAISKSPTLKSLLINSIMSTDEMTRSLYTAVLQDDNAPEPQLRYRRNADHGHPDAQGGRVLPPHIQKYINHLTDIVYDYLVKQYWEMPDEDRS